MFNMGDDDETEKRKRKLPPGMQSSSSSASGSAKKHGKPTKESDEKRKHIKSLIDKIPTDKTALFEYAIDCIVSLTAA